MNVLIYLIQLMHKPFEVDSNQVGISIILSFNFLSETSHIEMDFYL